MFLRFGSVPTIVVSSSEIAKQFLKTHDLMFDKLSDPLILFLDYLTDP